ncbi:MAG: DUF222 domain-containing protein [Sandaracinus sp.]|nr:DUF222 domain-containing protein [Sandaracinus sp.]MCB9612283.1 DUF222 domain-containing protein [Sandaracinus sp.]MCB9621031.1 DUF222 domain-containing protein [Sandaracinus sp.]
MFDAARTSMEADTTLDHSGDGEAASVALVAQMDASVEEAAFDAEAAEEELATLSSHLDAATYRQLVLIRQLDESGHWASAGATSCAAWLSWRIGMNGTAARERLRIAHALRELPKIADAMRTGTISYSKVRAIVRVATPKMEDQLLEFAHDATAAQLERICRGVRQRQLLDAEDDALDEAQRLRRAYESRDVVLRARGDGTVQVVATLMPDEAQRVFTAVETMRDAMRDECRSLPPSYADAFVRLVDVGFEEATVEVANDSAESFLANDDHTAGDSAESSVATDDHPADDSAESSVATYEHAADDSAESSHAADDSAESSHATGRAADDSAESIASTRRRKKVSGGDTQRVLIQLAPHLLSDGLVANLDDGTWIAPETWRRVACDCALDLVKLDERGTVLDVGRRTRTIPPALSRALDVRDAGRCRFPGCNHRRFLDRHHIEHWSNDGETKLDNLITLCDAHHRLVHEGGWTVELEGDEARFFRPDGAPLVWPRPPRVEDAVAELEETHVDLAIGATTGLTRWDGRTPEYAWCVDVVCRESAAPLAR